MYDRLAIANRIYTARKNKGFKQNDVCVMLGINQSSYSALELGKRDITVAELFTLSELLSVSIIWLLGIDSIPDLTDSERLDVEKYIRFIISIRKK
jgi:transcriptional regulator with XRE-family HTH domain